MTPRRKSLINRPASTQASFHGWIVKAKHTDPLSHAFGVSVDRGESVGPSINTLSSAFYPAAVVRLVIAVIVLAFDAVFLGRTRTHVCVEVSERMHPTVTHGNAARTVVAKLSSVRIKAAAFHRLPYRILTAAFHAVLACPAACALGHVASARRRCAGSDMGNANFFGSAAVTAAQNLSWFLVDQRNTSNHDETAEAFANHRRLFYQGIRLCQ